MSVQTLNHPSPSQGLEALKRLNLKRSGPVTHLTLSRAGLLIDQGGAPLHPLSELITADERAAWRQQLARGELPRYMDLGLLSGDRFERAWLEWEEAEGRGWLGYAYPAHEALWRRRLLSRSLAFEGIKHDLNNRLFLLRALPELSSFSEPRELLDDLIDELPLTLSFLSERLSSDWVQSRPLSSPSGWSGLEELAQLLGHLQRRGFNVIGAHEALKLSPPSTAQPLSTPFIGLLWSLCALCVQLRPSLQLEWSTGPQPCAPLGHVEPLKLTFHPSLELRHLSVSRCGRLIPTSPLQGLSLSGAELPWRAWAERCPLPILGGARPDLSHSSGEPPPADWGRFASLWMEGLAAAADLLGGGLVAAHELPEAQAHEGLTLYFKAPRS